MKLAVMLSLICACGMPAYVAPPVLPTPSIHGRVAVVPAGAMEGSFIHVLGDPCSFRTATLPDGTPLEVAQYGGQLLGADSANFWKEECGTTVVSEGAVVGPCIVAFYFGPDNTWDFVTATCPPLN